MVTIPGSLVVTGTTTTANIETTTVSNGVLFESNATGAHTDKETKLIGVTGLTSDVTITLPSTIGTLALSGAAVNYSALTGTVPTWNQSTTGTAATVTGAAQTAITSVGTLTALTTNNLTVDNLNLNGNIIESTGYFRVNATSGNMLFTNDDEANANFAVGAGALSKAWFRTPILKIDGNSTNKLTTGANSLVIDTNEGTNSGNITITAGADGAINITPNGTGATTIGKLTATNAVLTTPALGTPSAIVLTNASGFPTLNQSTSGNAATASALSSGQTIGMTGDVVWTSPSFDGSGDVTASATIQSGAIGAPELASTNTLASGIDNYVLSYNHAGSNFTWVAQTAGLTTEGVQDVVGAQLVTNGSHTGITASYDDGNDGAIDLVVGTLNQDTTGTADHVTVANNASVNESNRITFVEDAAGAGSRGLESDAAFHYNPSTGTVTATKFSGPLTGALTTTSIISTSNSDIAITPNGTGRIVTRGTQPTRVYPNTGTPNANSATQAQLDGIRHEYAKTTLSSLTNTSAADINIAPTNSVNSGTSSYRAITGTIHIDSGEGSFIYTEKFMANTRNGTAWDYQSFGSIYNTTTTPFSVTFTAENDELNLEIVNTSGSTITAATVWHDLTFFPST